MVTAAASATRRRLRRFRVRSKRGWDHSGVKTRDTCDRAGPNDGRAFVTRWGVSRWHGAVTVIARRPGVDSPGAWPAMSSRTRGSRPAPRRAHRQRRGWRPVSPVTWPRISGQNSGRTCGDGFPCRGFAAFSGATSRECGKSLPLVMRHLGHSCSRRIALAKVWAAARCQSRVNAA